LHFDPDWNLEPVYHWPLLAVGLTVLVTIGATGLTLWIGYRASTFGLFAALMPLSVILLPVAEEHHYVVMLIPIFYVAYQLSRRPLSQPRPWGRWLLFGSALFLFFVPIPYEEFWLGAGWMALLAYPRLYGGWLLWAAVMRWLIARPQEIGPEMPLYLSFYAPKYS
ncbi:MAG: hypothetical protein R3264_20200, partial [Anaerolineae bacterium]|nr:hypothetical protein [Anaerolineae bacterium]